jgi:hypothetical protein
MSIFSRIKTMRIGRWIPTLLTGAALALAVPDVLAAASCDKMDPCAAKACRLDLEIAQAQAKNNARQLASLQRAKAEIARCDDNGLKEKRKMALQQAQHRIDNADAALTKAQAAGNAAKIATAQKKADSARKAYAEIEASPL